MTNTNFNDAIIDIFAARTDDQLDDAFDALLDAMPDTSRLDSRQRRILDHLAAIHPTRTAMILSD